MQRLEAYMSQFEFYRDWHKDRKSTVLMWGILIAFSIITLNVVIGDINAYYHEIQVAIDTEQVARVIVQPSHPAKKDNQPHWRTVKDALYEGIVQPHSQVIELHLAYNVESVPSLWVTSATRMNGHNPDPELATGPFTLSILDQRGNKLFETPFDVPSEPLLPPPLPGVANVPLPEPPPDLSSVQFVLTIPWYARSHEAVIFDENGHLISTFKITGIPYVNNEPKFRTLPGKDALREAGDVSSVTIPSVVANISELLITTAEAASGGNQVLDVLFIGEDYSASNMATFYADADRFARALVTYEPFRTRASQIVFHTIESVQDLGCYYAGPGARLLLCDTNKAQTVANSFGVPWDYITIIVNNSTYGGAGGNPVSVAYNGSYGPSVFVHELAHSFARLVDEYVLYSYNGVVTNTANQNCLQGTPPTADWNGLSADYTLGCNYPNHYRSSYTSIMREIGQPYFNDVSIKYINDAFNNIANESTHYLLICPTTATVAVGSATQLDLRYWANLATTPTCSTTGYESKRTNSGTVWSSSNTAVATVDTGSFGGRVIGKSAGTITISATFSGMTTTSSVTVSGGATATTNLTSTALPSIASGVLTQGTNVTFGATVKNSGTSNISLAFSNNFTYCWGTGCTPTTILGNHLTQSALNSDVSRNDTSASLSLTQSGVLRVQHCVDSLGQITESIETIADNCKTKDFTVAAQTPTAHYLLICPANPTIAANTPTNLSLRLFLSRTSPPDCSLTTGFSPVEKAASTVWSSSNTSIATVESGSTNGGRVTGKAGGTVTVTATYGSGSTITATSSVTVSAPTATPRLLICPTTATVAVGSATQLDLRYWANLATTPTCSTTGYESKRTNSGTVWSSSNTAVATVDTGSFGGRVIGKSAGTITISATFSGMTTTSSVTVR